MPGTNGQSGGRVIRPLFPAHFFWFVLVLALSACLAGDPRLLSPDDAARLMEANRHQGAFVLLDIRTVDEFRQGHIEGARLMDYYRPDFREKFASLDREATILMYCRSGNRSSHVLELADQLGFRNIYDLRGGILAWKKNGRPLVRP